MENMQPSRWYYRLSLICLIGFSVAALLTIGFLLSLYYALKAEPTFYQKAIAVSRETQTALGNEVVGKAKSMFEEISPTDSHWELKLSEEEINAYLAADWLASNPDPLPPEIRNPRIAIENDRLELACEVGEGTLSGVLRLTLTSRFPEPNQCIIRLREAHLGMVPFSKEKIRLWLGDGLKNIKADCELTDEEGDPAIRITFNIVPDKRRGIALRPEEARFEGNSLVFSGSAAFGK